MEQYSVFDRYIHPRNLIGHDTAYYGITFNRCPLLANLYEHLNRKSFCKKDTRGLWQVPRAVP
jgi:hypothetical protein